MLGSQVRCRDFFSVVFLFILLYSLLFCCPPPAHAPDRIAGRKLAYISKPHLSLILFLFPFFCQYLEVLFFLVCSYFPLFFFFLCFFRPPPAYGPDSIGGMVAFDSTGSGSATGSASGSFSGSGSRQLHRSPTVSRSSTDPKGVFVL